MELNGVAGGVMLLAAAALWLAYLVPSWFRRREYLSTEKNAVRLQQTLRVLAETAEVPQTVRAEASARSVAEHQRVLRAELQRNEAIMQARAAAAARADARRIIGAPLATAPAFSPARTARLRRSRRLASLGLLAAISIAIVQLSLVFTTGAVLGSWVVLAIASVGVFGSVRLLAALSSVRRIGAASAATVAVAQPRSAPATRAAASTTTKEWTPVPLPKPLYLSRGVARPEPVDSRLLTAALDAAVAEGERALRAALAEPEVIQFTARTAAPAVAVAPAPQPAPSRFASMGIIDETTIDTADVDAMLRRRRTAV